jgi:DNA invertase Pin-like site-specific DNA recombinase
MSGNADFRRQSGQHDCRTRRRTITVAKVGHARVSPLGQNTGLQLDALSTAGCAQVCEDHASGARADRTGLRQALDHVRDGDRLIVWKRDRLARGLQHLIETVATLEKRGAGCRTITEAIDTATPGGRLVFRLFGALGQFEKDLIQERSRPASQRPRRGDERVGATPSSPSRSSGVPARSLARV